MTLHWRNDPNWDNEPTSTDGRYLITEDRDKYQSVFIGGGEFISLGTYGSEKAAKAAAEKDTAKE